MDNTIMQNQIAEKINTKLPKNRLDKDQTPEQI